MSHEQREWDLMRCKCIAVISRLVGCLPKHLEGFVISGFPIELREGFAASQNFSEGAVSKIRKGQQELSCATSWTLDSCTPNT
jgi:hypothetical protein